ncbi:MAG: OmpA family protein [Verrucomicrobia bacterium]|nr:OmpA family protein [Verrucomicrobiota bacterium]
MDKQIWLIASGLTAVFLIAVLVLVAHTKTREATEARAALAEVQAAVARSETQAEALREQLTGHQARIRELEQEKETVAQSRQSLEDEMRAALESRDVTISQLQGKLTVNILDRVLFDSGEAQLKPDGEAVLRQVAAILVQHPNVPVHVVGHTDNVPIRPGARGRFPSNWELSTARATAAVRFLTERGGVEPRRVGAVGYGEFRPVADNATAEGRAQNRRIAITILADELAGADAPAPRPNPEPAPDAPDPTMPVNP